MTTLTVTSNAAQHAHYWHWRHNTFNQSHAPNCRLAEQECVTTLHHTLLLLFNVLLATVNMMWLWRDHWWHHCIAMYSCSSVSDSCALLCMVCVCVVCV